MVASLHPLLYMLEAFCKLYKKPGILVPFYIKGILTIFIYQVALMGGHNTPELCPKSPLVNSHQLKLCFQPVMVISLVAVTKWAFRAQLGCVMATHQSYLID